MAKLKPLKELIDERNADKKRCQHYADMSVKLYLFMKRAEAEKERKEAEACKPNYIDPTARYGVVMRGDL